MTICNATVIPATINCHPEAPLRPKFTLDAVGEGRSPRSRGSRTLDKIGDLSLLGQLPPATANSAPITIRVQGTPCPRLHTRPCGVTVRALATPGAPEQPRAALKGEHAIDTHRKS